MALDFDIDRFINPFVPRSRLYLLPRPISWVLGYRSSQTSQIGEVVVWIWAFVGAFCGMLVIEAVFHTEALRSHGTPIIIASLGAAAILEYHTIDSPFSQPRNALFGQLFSAIIGVGITKLFQLNPDFESLRWIAGAISVATASSFMGFTKTVHPPAGATALLAATSPDITDLGWFFIPLIVLGSSLMIATACIINNIQRKFPIYWWTPVDLSQHTEVDVEDQGESSKEDESTSSNLKYVESTEPHIFINERHISIPDWLSLDAEEKLVLEIFRSKLQEKLKTASIPQSMMHHETLNNLGLSV